jgi:sec-independent protein translocase protein TatA
LEDVLQFDQGLDLVGLQMPQGWELLIILALVFLLFGAKKMPDAARGIGKSLRILKTETKGLHEDEDTDVPEVENADRDQIADAGATQVQPRIDVSGSESQTDLREPKTPAAKETSATE